MTRLGLRHESAWQQVYASGCTDGDTHGASVKASFVSILSHICERGLIIDGGERKKWEWVEVLCCDASNLGLFCRTMSKM
jgi:hypothetical protein